MRAGLAYVQRGPLLVPSLAFRGAGALEIGLSVPT